MRAFTLVLVLALLAAYASAVSVPFKSCGSSSDDGTIDSIDANAYPPVIGQTLQLNITGNLTREVTAGCYTVMITIDGFPVTGPTGNVSDFHPLPWPVGQLNITYSYLIPSAAPSGSYAIGISALDQDIDEILCISLSFNELADTQQGWTCHQPPRARHAPRHGTTGTAAAEEHTVGQARAVMRQVGLTERR